MNLETRPEQLKEIFLNLIHEIKILKINLSGYLIFGFLGIFHKYKKKNVNRKNIGENEVNQLSFLCELFPHLTYIKLNLYE